MNKLEVLSVIFASLGLTLYIVAIIIYYFCNLEPIWNALCITAAMACGPLTLTFYLIDELKEEHIDEKV